MMTNVMVKTCLYQKIIKNSNLIQAIKNSVCPTPSVARRPIFSQSRIFRSFRIVDSTHDMIIVKWHLLNFSKAEFVGIFCRNIYRMFRSVDWTHDMIIVKWHLFIWHERKLCALTNAPTVQSTKTGQWLSTLFHANCSAAQVYVLHPGQFTFAPSCRQRSFLQVLQSTERRERYCEKYLLYLMMTNVMMKTCLNQKIIKISNLIQAMKNSVCPTPNVTRRPIFSESWIFWSFELWIQHTTWRSWSDTYWIFRKPNLSEYLPNVPKCGLNTRHDNREVTLIHLTRAQTLRSDKCATGYSMLTVLPLRLMSCTLGNSHSLQAAGDDHSCRYYNPLSAKKDILKNFLCIWWWQMLWWKHVLTKTYKNFESDSGNEESRMSEAKVMRRPNFSECRIFRSVD